MISKLVHSTSFFLVFFVCLWYTLYVVFYKSMVILMKKFIALFLCFCTIFCFASCGKKPSGEDSNSNSSNKGISGSSSNSSSYSSSSNSSVSGTLERPTGYTSFKNSGVILCYGDSLTDGFGSENGCTYPAFLEQFLKGSYNVINAGSSGENSLAALTRALVKKPLIKKDIVFPKGEKTVKISDNFLYFPGSKEKIIYDGMGNELKIDTLKIGSSTYRLARTGGENPFSITRQDASSALTLKADTPVNYDFSAYYTEIYCGIVLMGNNHTYAITADELIQYYREFAAAHEKYILIIPHWRSDLTKALKAEFGDNALDVMPYFLDGALKDYLTEPTVLDEWCVKKGILPASFRKDNNKDEVHLNSLGYKVLGELIYKQGVKIGYWK